MSINSKARRDAKKRKLAKSRNAAAAAPTGKSIEPHAELRNAEGQLLGGIVRREGEWTLGLGGRIAGSSESAAQVLALLKRATALHERQGDEVKLTYSSVLRTAANQEVAALGLSFEQYEAKLEQELASGGAPPLSAPTGGVEALH